MQDKATYYLHLQVIVFCRHAVVATIQNPTIEDYTVHIYYEPPFRLFMLIQQIISTNPVPS